MEDLPSLRPEPQPDLIPPIALSHDVLHNRPTAAPRSVDGLETRRCAGVRSSGCTVRGSDVLYFARRTTTGASVSTPQQTTPATPVQNSTPHHHEGSPTFTADRREDATTPRAQRQTHAPPDTRTRDCLERPASPDYAAASRIPWTPASPSPPQTEQPAGRTTSRAHAAAAQAQPAERRSRAQAQDSVQTPTQCNAITHCECYGYPSQLASHNNEGNHRATHTPFTRLIPLPQLRPATESQGPPEAVERLLGGLRRRPVGAAARTTQAHSVHRSPRPLTVVAYARSRPHVPGRRLTQRDARRHLTGVTRRVKSRISAETDSRTWPTVASCSPSPPPPCWSPPSVWL
jgi:hypothetical protein